ncbi:HNH endonuclease [Thermoplasmatota archaeon]
MSKSIWDIDINDVMGGKKSTKRKKPKQSIKSEVLVRQNYRCKNCDDMLPATKHFHYKTPISKGGKNTVNNLIALCPNCHSEHHHKQRVKYANAKAKGSKKKSVWDMELGDI